MTLRDYLKNHGISATEFAGRIGLKGAKSIYKYFGSSIPRPDIMSRIVEATNGKVTANDFYKEAK